MKSHEVDVGGYDKRKRITFLWPDRLPYKVDGPPQQSISQRTNERMASITESVSGLFPDSTPIDPNLMYVNWDVLFEQLVLVVVVATIVERALSTGFETSWFINYQTRRKAENGSTGGIKTIIALIVSFIVCVFYQIDILAVLLSHARVSLFGELITAGVVAGGSKASLKLFRDVMGIRSTAREEYEKNFKAGTSVATNPPGP